jgi:hypothetical protein
MEHWLEWAFMLKALIVKCQTSLRLIINTKKEALGLLFAFINLIIL